MSEQTCKQKLIDNFLLGGFFPRTLSENVMSTIGSSNDEAWMSEALITAMNAIGWSSPNPGVGCVIVKNNQIIAQGFTQAYRHEHAEKMAFLQLQKNNISDLSDAIAYVTLEPCAHQGNQPPCLDLFVNSNIKKIVIGCMDPDVRVSGRSIEALTQVGKNICTGVLENECRAWHHPFLKTRSAKKIYWAAKWAESKNGFLAAPDGTSKWITNEKSRAYTHWLRQKYDAILVGAQTWLFDRPRLTVRDCAQPIRREPLKLIYDPNGKLLADSSILEKSGKMKVFVKEEVLKSHLALIHLPLVEWIPISQKAPIESLIEKISHLSIQSVMVEGGPRLLNLLFKEDIFDVYHQFVGSKVLDNANNQFTLSPFTKSSFFQIAGQKIDDDYLHEWSKCF